jgi:hypothetical protein
MESPFYFSIAPYQNFRSSRTDNKGSVGDVEACFEIHRSHSHPWLPDKALISLCPTVLLSPHM